jgi:hypothetical protein
VPRLALPSRRTELWSQAAVCQIRHLAAPVGKDQQTLLQQITGKFNWYARTVDPTMLTPLSALAAQQSKPTVKTMN